MNMQIEYNIAKAECVQRGADFLKSLRDLPDEQRSPVRLLIANEPDTRFGLQHFDDIAKELLKTMFPPDKTYPESIDQFKKDSIEDLFNDGRVRELGYVRSFGAYGDKLIIGLRLGQE